MTNFWKTLSTIEEIIMVIGMVIMVFFNAFNVFCRYLLPQSPFSYTEELVVLVFVWVSMIGISYCYRRRSHTVLNVLTDTLPDAVQPVIIIFSAVCSMLLMALMVYTGWNAMMNQIRYKQIMPGMGLPMAFAGAATPVACFLSFFSVLKTMLDELKEHKAHVAAKKGETA